MENVKEFFVKIWKELVCEYVTASCLKFVLENVDDNLESQQETPMIFDILKNLRRIYFSKSKTSKHKNEITVKMFARLLILKREFLTPMTNCHWGFIKF